jgi:hypothetical protein
VIDARLSGQVANATEWHRGSTPIIAAPDGSKTRLFGGTLDERSSSGVKANSQAPRDQLARTTYDR